MRTTVCIALTALALSACRQGQAPTQLNLATSLDGPWPPIDGGSPLRAFVCKRPHGEAKSPHGTMTISFRPRDEANVTFHLEFQCDVNCYGVCDYSADVRLDDGRLNDGFLGMTYVERCRRSPLTGFAVDCGRYLGSSLMVEVTANTVQRAVRFSMPPTFTAGLPDRDASDTRLPCLPFVSYAKRERTQQDSKSLDSSALSFPLDACHFE